MPISAVIRLFPQEDAWLPPTMGHLAHAAFLSLFDRVSPTTAGRLHRGDDLWPFTVSPLQGPFERQDRERLLVRAGTACRLRFTLLEDALLQPFSRFFGGQVSRQVMPGYSLHCDPTCLRIY